MVTNNQNKNTTPAILKILQWAYDKALSTAPFPGIDSVFDLVQNYRAHEGTVSEQVDALIRWQDSKAAGIGFVSGVGGIFLMPFGISFDLACTLFIQIRLIAAIAVLGGYDVQDDRVKALVFACLCGTPGLDVLKSFSIHAGKHAVMTSQKEVLKHVQKALGVRLLAKTGKRGAVFLTNFLPLIGGLIGGTFDAVTTHTVGKIAKRVFINGKA